jgi:hypothetical protein
MPITEDRPPVLIEPQAFRARRPHLALLAVLTDSQPGAPLPAGAAAEVAEAAGEILAQAEAAVSEAVAGRHPATGEFLTARLTRLKAAADDAVAAARGGDAADLRACVLRFGTLTSALWTVREAVVIPAPRDPRRCPVR